jgi:hypothetical protein
MKNWNGSIRSSTINTPTTLLASGRWSSNEIIQAKSSSTWPNLVIPTASSFVTATTKVPVLGNGSAGSWTPAGWTSIQNGNNDDGNVTASIPFTFTFNGTNYTAAFIGSNGYITFGSGSSNYSGLSASNPAINKIMMAAGDNSYQRIAHLSSGTSYTRFRYEGNSGTSGTPGSSGRIYEITIFNPANYFGEQVIEYLVGNFDSPTSGVTGVYSSSASLLAFTFTALSSFVFIGNSAGTTWTKYTGYINNSGY